MLTKGYLGGTHRAVPPATTLERITPLLSGFGVTRLADVTRLDLIGIPTYCAIRPAAATVQVSNGKGLAAVDAKVSALMEAIELHHAENPVAPIRNASLAELRAAGLRAVEPASLEGFRRELHLDERCRMEWVDGEDLWSGERVVLPAAAVYHRRRSHFAWSSNGLASGNHVVEATLHALYEVLERHTLSQLVSDGQIAFGDCDVIDLATVAHPGVASLIERVQRAGLQLILLRAPSATPVHTFMAVLCDAQPFGLRVRIDPGYGAHLDPGVAAIRAITEAAQGRLSVIHGSREDVRETTYMDDHQRTLYDFFVELEPDCTFATLESHAGASLAEDHDAVVAATRAAGFGGLHRVELTHPRGAHAIAVVKVFLLGAENHFPV
jgi:ribosomal protein S12 methylthiotransferase accessory factor